MFYCLEYGKMCSYMTWGSTYENCKDDCALGTNLKALENKETDFCLILTQKEYEKYLNQNYTKVAQTEESIIGENYILYKYHKS